MIGFWNKNKGELAPELEQRERLISYQRLFKTADGKDVIYDLMNRFHILNSHKGDAFMEGQRSAVLYILNNCSISIEALDKMLKGE